MASLAVDERIKAEASSARDEYSERIDDRHIGAGGSMLADKAMTRRVLLKLDFRYVGWTGREQENIMA